MSDGLAKLAAATTFTAEEEATPTRPWRHLLDNVNMRQELEPRDADNAGHHLQQLRGAITILAAPCSGAGYREEGGWGGARFEACLWATGPRRFCSGTGCETVGFGRSSCKKRRNHEDTEQVQQ